ncbi:ADP-ribosylglycohydrolase family protein [Sporolactobacillus sp. Y61]|jgi:ADP-ribosylglycohydrolase|uniref:ADP-ribosylglycohydrolase family protein n=1 Tax=Sporolactobacillus sp. Y61 TaxID=3160863 RepID=A0AAU8IEW8_9BACL
MIKDRILGALYGQAIGDAMGMPSELWPVQKIRACFAGRMTTFQDGPKSNPVARNYTKGQYTDDTNQAFAILDALIENHWIPDRQIIVKHLMKWAYAADAFNRNILGPSSKAALLAIQDGRDPKSVTDQALTNGSGMRIAPIGTLFDPGHTDELIAMVDSVTRVTHSSDVAISGAALIAGAVCAALAFEHWDDVIDYAIDVQNRAFKLGSPTWAASVRERLFIGLDLAHKYVDDQSAFEKAIYETVGTGTLASESIPAAVAIAYYARDVRRCALLAANLGGDTDTIGAMATAICGAKAGFGSIDPDWTGLIDSENRQHCIPNYAEAIMKFREGNNES